MRRLCVLLPLLLASSVVVADPHARGSDLVYGAGIAFMVRAPGGWVLATESGRDLGLDAVYHAAGSSFGDAGAVAFARALPKQHQTAAQLIDQTITGMSDQAPDLVVDPPSTWTCGKKRGRLVTVAHDPAGKVEALLFIDEPGAVVVLGLLADSEARRTAALPRLRELCASYRFVGPVTP